MEVIHNNYIPGDPRLVEELVSELKSQGIFDQFRKECISDVDTKPAYQNLRQRVEGTVSSFLNQQSWSFELNKNQLREQLRKNLQESGFLETGVERMVDQVVNPKINTVFLPKVEEVVYRFLGIKKPTLRNVKKEEKNVTITDLLPTDLEAVSPESVDSFKNEKNTESLNDSLNSSGKLEEDESPPFEPIGVENSCENSNSLDENKMHVDENSRDSHLSGFSGLQSHESHHGSEAKNYQMDLSNQDSLNSSETHLSIITSEDTTKMEICEDSNNEIKNEKIEIESLEAKAPIDSDASLVFKETKKEDTSFNNDSTEKHNDSEKKHNKSEDKKSRSSERSKDRKDGKYRKSSSSKEKDRSSKHSSHKDIKDKDSNKKDSRSSSSHKEKDKSKDKSDKDKQSYKHKEKSEKDKSKYEQDKKIEKSKSDKDIANKAEKEKIDKDKDKKKSDKGKSNIDKSNRDKDKYTKDKEKTRHRDKSDKNDKDRHSSKSKEKSDRDKEKNSKEKPLKEKDATKELKEKNKDNEKDKNKISSSTTKHSSAKDKKKENSSNSNKDKSSSNKDGAKITAEDSKSKSSDKTKKEEIKHSSSKKDSRDSRKKSKDDHYSSKIKKSGRRSTDRDSNDGTSSKNNYMCNYQESMSSKSENNSQDCSSSSFTGGSGDSGNSNQVELVNKEASESSSGNLNTDANNSSQVLPVKYLKPKFASNFEEARKIMRIRKQLAKLERQNQLSLSKIEVPTQNGLDIKEESASGENIQCKVTLNNEEHNVQSKPIDLKDNEDIPAPELTSKKAESLNNEDTTIKLSNKNSMNSKSPKTTTLETLELSTENFKALESKLAQVMSKIKDDSYESDDEEYEFHGYSSADVQNVSSDQIAELNSAKLGDAQVQNNATRKKNQNEKINENCCRYLEKPRLEDEKKLKFLQNIASELRKEIKETSKNNFWPINKGTKRKLNVYVDLKNNNDMEYVQTVNKRRGSATSKTITSKANKKRMCNNTDITPTEHFPLPLSPAESDKSNDRKEEELLIPIKQKRIVRGYSQRYTSEDLYKPRPVIGRRNKLTKNTG